MIAVVAVLLRLVLRQRLLREARAQADKALTGSMEGHAAAGPSTTSAPNSTARPG